MSALTRVGRRIESLVARYFDASLPEPEGLPRYVAPLPEWLEDVGLRLAWPIAIVNLLGTAFDAPGYRLQQRDLGIGSQPDYPRDYPGQLLAPFRELPHGEVPELPEGLRRRG